MKTFGCFVRRKFPYAALIAFVIAASTVQAADVTVDGHRFSLPEGFTLEMAAGPPLVQRPICADFDEQGRLYVADSSGSNENVKIQLMKRPHRILRLEDSDGDGRFDKSTVFADRMMFPEGTLWHDGSLYVAAPPSIWKLTDTDGDGKADQREEWFQGKTLTGCANDLHGPYLGPDGFIYWCKGAFAQQTYERPGKKPLVTTAAHIFRRHPSGGPIEPVMTGGMDNPVEVTFTPGGERLFTTTFVQHPGGGKRDALLHAVYGGVYGKVHRVIDGHPRTGDLMPVLSHFGAGAPCGLVCLQSDQLGNGFQGNVLVTLFNLHKVARHVLKPVGGTFETKAEDFLTTDDFDFHPTDIIEDGDGSLLVVDTGGWYKLCCPTSQLWKPDILGAIYRIRRTGRHKVADAFGRRFDPKTMDAWLSDSRPAVRKQAQHLLAKQGKIAIPSLAKIATTSTNPNTRRHAVWTLTRIDHPQARKAVRSTLADSDEFVRQAAIHSVSVRKDQKAVPALLGLLKNPSLHNRRAAAEALGRVGNGTIVSDLLTAVAPSYGRVLEHSHIFAIIEIGDVEATRRGLKSNNSSIRRAALIALDQMEGAQLTPQDVKPLLSSKDDVLNATAWWITERHEDWGPALVEYFHDEIARKKTSRQQLSSLASRLARFAHHQEIQQLIATGLKAESTPQATKLALLTARASSRLKLLPQSWSVELRQLVGSKDSPLLRKTVSTIHAFSGSNPGVEISAELGRLSRDESYPVAVRLEALAALPKATRLDSDVFRFLTSELSVDQPVRERSLSVDVLLNASLTDGQLNQLAESLAQTGPMEVKRLLTAFEKSVDDESLGLKLVNVLEQAPAATSLQPEELETWFKKFGETVSTRAQKLCDALKLQDEEKREQVASVLTLIEKADIRRGQQVFHSSKVACSACHALGYLGRNIGPDLTRIGRIRSDRDLLESILFPSQSFVRSYEPVLIATTAGKVVNGLIREETESEVVLAIDAQKLVRIPHSEIEERRDGKVSIMPAGLLKQLSGQDLADLVAFLRAAK